MRSPLLWFLRGDYIFSLILGSYWHYHLVYDLSTTLLEWIQNHTTTLIPTNIWTSGYGFSEHFLIIQHYSYSRLMQYFFLPAVPQPSRSLYKREISSDPRLCFLALSHLLHLLFGIFFPEDVPFSAVQLLEEKRNTTHPYTFLYSSISKYHNDDKWIASIIRSKDLHVAKDIKDKPIFQVHSKLMLMSGPLAIPLVKTSNSNPKSETRKYTPPTRGQTKTVSEHICFLAQNLGQ